MSTSTDYFHTFESELTQEMAFQYVLHTLRVGGMPTGTADAVRGVQTLRLASNWPDKLQFNGMQTMSSQQQQKC